MIAGPVEDFEFEPTKDNIAETLAAAMADGTIIEEDNDDEEDGLSSDGKTLLSLDVM